MTLRRDVAFVIAGAHTGSPTFIHVVRACIVLAQSTAGQVISGKSAPVHNKYGSVFGQLEGIRYVYTYSFDRLWRDCRQSLK